MLRIRSLVAAVVLLGLPAFGFGQADVPPAEPYAAAIEQLEKLIAHEVDDKKLPAVSIALVDDQRVVWARGFGFQDREKKIPATANTVYRVGSVSKLFTDIAVMQLVEKGDLDLDAPVAKYLPDFKPTVKPEHKPITLRMLTSHRSGLIREPPVGNYFDPTEPGLEKTVLSLNGIDLVYAPGERIKYSNGAIALVGYTVQKTQNEKFEPYVKRKVLDPLGMANSSFELTSELKKNLADAVMWSYHGREFPAPTFELGEAPAGCMYSTVLDLAKFQSALFNDGKPVLKSESLKEMLTPQFAGKGDTRGFGIGFAIGDLDGRKKIGHGGAIYGFATQLEALPNEKLGVVIVCSRDVANSVMTRIANESLRLMLAIQEKQPLPKIETSEPLTREEVLALAGTYAAGDRSFELTASATRLFFESDRGGARYQLKKSGDDLITDDTLTWGNKLTRGGGTLTMGKVVYTKQKDSLTPPADVPEKWKGLIGEYGWDHNTLFIYEKAGKLHALIEWIEIDPLTEESENVFAFPNAYMYPGEKLIFARDKSGRATKVEAARVVFERRKIDGENGETFRIKPVRPLDELRKEALAATPPVEKGEFLQPDLVDLSTIEGLKFDLRYATDNNFLSAPFYTSSKAFFQRPAAESLKRVQEKLKPLGYGLIIYDSYRPWHVTKMFWDATPAKFHNFVADPSKGSRHNRGCAVDLGLYDLKTGKVIEMVAGFDEFSDRAYPDYPGGTSRQRWHRELLRKTMESESFTVYEEEWWHFDFKDWKRYPVLNSRFEDLGK